jgi:RAD50-interacting protein 1
MQDSLTGMRSSWSFARISACCISIKTSHSHCKSLYIASRGFATFWSYFLLLLVVVKYTVNQMLKSTCHRCSPHVFGPRLLSPRYAVSLARDFDVWKAESTDWTKTGCGQALVWTHPTPPRWEPHLACFFLDQRPPLRAMAAAFLPDFPLGEPDIRLEDFLDDKLQSTTDLDNLDALLVNIDLQRSQLQEQLDNVSKELDAARRSTGDRQGALHTQIGEFHKLQSSIDVRLQIVASSDAPDEAIRRLELPMKQLQKVDLAYKYLVLLLDVESLRAEARSHLPKRPKDALQSYTQLKQLSIRLGELQGPADGAATHLVHHVAKTTENLWGEMKRIMSSEFEALLEKHDWPNVDLEVEVDEEWREEFEKLVDMQVPEILYAKEVVPLLPIDAMAQILIKEFRYHFMSSKRTSDPQQIGDVCFPWFLDRVEKWADFLKDNFSYILAARFNDSPVAGKMVYLDPACALVTSLLPVMREKVLATAAEAVKSPSFLSSFMRQLLAFDEDVRSRFDYDGGDLERGWAGLASEVLNTHFDQWLKAEKDFALERFEAIMETPDARTIDYEYSGAGKTKPTFGAVRVTDLLRSVTTQYEKIKRFSHKLRFLIDIQLAILDEFHDRLRGSLEAYYSINSTVGRTLHGVTKEQLAALEGTGAFETLCKVFGSADHIVNTLKDWSNEEVTLAYSVGLPFQLMRQQFFVTLWDQLQTRAKQAEGQNNLAGGMTYDHVKDRTSAAVGSEEDGGVLFDETISAYNMRKKASQGFLVSALTDSHTKAFRPYLQRVQWTTIVDDISTVDAYQLAITAELDEPLRVCRLTRPRQLAKICLLTIIRL